MRSILGIYFYNKYTDIIRYLGAEACLNIYLGFIHILKVILYSDFSEPFCDKSDRVRHKIFHLYYSKISGVFSISEFLIRGC